MYDQQGTPARGTQDATAFVVRGNHPMRSAPAHYAPAMSLEVPTLYDWAGGDDAFTRLINAFYDRVEQDDLLSPFFPGGVRQ
jgi:hypothetical protein